MNPNKHNGKNRRPVDPATPTSSNGPTSGTNGARDEPDPRDPRGRFAKGHPGGPGNPFARQVAQLRRALIAAVTDDDIKAVAQKLIEQARTGDVPSARLLFAYAVGKPSETVNPDRLDFDEWQIYRQTPVDVQPVATLGDCMTVDVACDFLRTTMPYFSARAAQFCIDRLTAPEPGATGAGLPSGNVSAPPAKNRRARKRDKRRRRAENAAAGARTARGLVDPLASRMDAFDQAPSLSTVNKGK